MNVVFIIHSRTEVTRRVFSAIREAKPDRLFVVADGPKDSAQMEKCVQTRAVTEQVDWQCEVYRNYSEKNLGCRERVISGLNWVFDQVEDAIILEDDCLPSQSFCQFCVELLARYADDERVGYISGQNFVGVPKGMNDSYWLSKYGGIWGWATWRRAWKLFDKEMSDWPVQGTVWTREYFVRPWVASYWNRIYELAYSNKMNAWGYNWAYTLQRRGIAAIVPAKNLVLNIGFDEHAAHTARSPSFYRKACLENLSFPLKHPKKLAESISFDRAYEHRVVASAVMQCQWDKYTNRYFYGKLFRKVPVLGPIWAEWRSKAKPW